MPAPAPTRLASFKDALTAALALAVVIMAIVIWRQHIALRRLAANEERDARPAAVALRTAQARSVLVAPARTRARMPDELRTPDDAAELAATRRALPPPARPAAASPLARLLDNPEFFEALALQRRATLDARFAALFRRLALGEEELTAFKRLLAEKDSVALDVVAVSESQPDGPLSSEQLDAGIVAAQAPVEAAIRATLGHERYAVYQDYQRTLPQRALVARLEQRLSYSSAPLAPAQAESLVQILVAHAPAAPAGAAAGPAPVVIEASPAATAPLATAATASARISDAAVNESQTVLAPRQVAALREIQLEQQAAQRTSELLRDNLPAGTPRGSLLRRTFLQ